MTHARMARRRQRRGRQQRRRIRRQARVQRRRARPNYRKNWIECQRHLLTPILWKAVHAATGTFRARRWKLMPLVMVAMLTLFLTARSLGERFEEARELWTRLYPSRRRVGRTVQGFFSALGRLPWPALKTLERQLRPRVATLLGGRWDVAGWIPFGVDGSRLAVPRYAKLERCLGSPGKGEFPQMWLTSLVHLPTGVPWSWRLGKATSSERKHLLQLLPTLPPRSLVVADAGFVGFDGWKTMTQQGQAFLIRLSPNCSLYVDYEVTLDFAEGVAYLWPTKQQKRTGPLRLRLLRVAGNGPSGAKRDLWMATNVLEPTALSRQTAITLFRMRWEQEVFYRSYKVTLEKAKLASRTVGQAVREVELALLATQLFLAQANWAVQQGGAVRPAGAAGAARQVRREMRDLLRGGLRPGYLRRLARCVREHRPTRTSAKSIRDWPRRTPHEPPGPPKIIRMNDQLKQAIEKELAAA
jgi:DDE family transposase